MSPEHEKATPRPWRIEPETGPKTSDAGVIASIGIWSEPKYGEEVAEGDPDDDPMDNAWVCGIWGKISDEDRANAALIVAAVNAYDEHRALLAELVTAASKLLRTAEQELVTADHALGVYETRAALARAKALGVAP